MINKLFRFHGYGSLKYVYRSGKTVRGQIASLKYSPNPRRDQYRLAVVVSKKVSKRATVRNRIRRRVYEVFRSFEKDFEGAYDMVLSVYSESVATMPAGELRKFIEDQLLQAGIIVQKP